MLTYEQIEFLNLVCLTKWAEENGVINTYRVINLKFHNLTQIPVQFGQANGNFYCQYNKLLNLKGCPFIVIGNFDCDSNQLTSLEGGPKEVDAYYSCQYNQLTNLIGAPKICNDNFFCYHNKLSNLEGCPLVIKKNLDCGNNPNLEYLWGIGHVHGRIAYDNHNEINEWIIECMRKDIIFPYFTLEENVNWIKITGQYSCLLGAPQEIRQMFSKYELTYIDMLC